MSLGRIRHRWRMVSDASKKKAAAKKAAAVAKRGSKSAAAGLEKAAETQQNGTNGVTNDLARLGITDRTCTGVLASHPQSRDIHVSDGTFSPFLSFPTSSSI